MLFKKLLAEEQQNFLFASILGDGEITKIARGSRRINNNYREHFSPQQRDYRRWKVSKISDILYFNSTETTIYSRYSLCLQS